MSMLVGSAQNTLGKTIKLREPPYNSHYQVGVERQPMAELIALGMVKT
jgi:hypothetical protein